jgi:hypothetical protein
LIDVFSDDKKAEINEQLAENYYQNHLKDRFV